MITDEKMLKISNQVDDWLANLVVEQDLAPLPISAIILARMALLNRFVDTEKEYSILLSETSKTISEVVPNAPRTPNLH
jgi:hypothetical protein